MNGGTDKFAKVPPESIDAFVAQAELMIAGTIQLGIAADSKAITFASVFGAISAALAIAAATMLVASEAARFHHFIAGCTAAAFVMFLAVLCFATAASPAAFHVAGHEPRLLAPSAEDRTWMLRYVALSLQKRIDENREALDRSAIWTRRGLGFAILAVLFGIFFYAAA